MPDDSHQPSSSTYFPVSVKMSVYSGRFFLKSVKCGWLLDRNCRVANNIEWTLEADWFHTQQHPPITASAASGPVGDASCRPSVRLSTA